MKTDYLFIPVKGDIVEYSVDLPEDPGYDALKGIVEPLLGGAYLERVAVLYEDKGTDMFVDETGALKGLPRNDRATAIYRNFTLTQQPFMNPEELAPVYGPVVLFLRPVWF